jgi:hypothetical protein
VAKVGLEPTDTSALPTKDLQQSQQSSAAQSGAVDDATLLALIQSLPAEERARLYAALRGYAAPDIAPNATNTVEAPSDPSSPACGPGAAPGPSVED